MNAGILIDQLNEQMDALGDVDGDLEAIREERREELDAYNMEIARLKREARQLVNEKDAAIPDEDEDRTRSHIFLDVEALDDDEEFRPKTQKKLTDNIFIIMLTGILVVAEFPESHPAVIYNLYDRICGCYDH